MKSLLSARQTEAVQHAIKGPHEYTAIGDVVSIAARLEELTRQLGFPVVCSKAVAEAVGLAGGLTELGEQTVSGGAMLPVCGWYPPLLAAN